MKYTNILKNNPLRRTQLYDWHLSKNAQMVPFAGWSMPLQYKGVGQVEAHNHVRNQVGLFDVSHMQQIVISQSSDNVNNSFVHSILPISLNQPTNTSSYSLILNDQGGIIDDCIITKWNNNLWYLVTNANRSQVVRRWLDEKLNKSNDSKVNINYLNDTFSLLALQGPKASEVLSKLSKTSLNELYFGSCYQNLQLANNINVHLARSGYTGEDGFEISVENRDAVTLANMLTDENTSTMPIGLGARDSLRIEAGMCLYGNDLWESPDLTVGETGLGWTIAKDRRTNESLKFPGWDNVIPSLKYANMNKRRVGILVEKGPAARSGAEILNDEDQVIGFITSGCPSPTLNNQNVSIGYINKTYTKMDHDPSLKVRIRGKNRKANIVKLPFVESKYYRKT